MAESAVAADTPKEEAPCAPSLPPEVLRLILRLLPVDARMCAAGVSPAWRAAADATLFASLDLSTHTGGLARPASDGLLRAAAARAAGALTALDLRGCEAVSYRALLAVVRAHAATLATLHTGALCFTPNTAPATGQPRAHAPAPVDVFRLEALLRGGAPALTCLGASVAATKVAEASRLLEAQEAPLAPLRVHALHLATTERAVDAAVWARFTGALGSATALRALHLRTHHGFDAAWLDDVVDAALAARLRSLTLQDCRLNPPGMLRALARLLAEGALTDLTLHNCCGMLRVMGDMTPAPPADVALFFDALRTCGSLRRLSLHTTGVCVAPSTAVALLGALTGHASLASLTLHDHFATSKEAALHVDGALAALLDAPSSALTHLDVPWCSNSAAAAGGADCAVGAGSAFAAAARRNAARVAVAPARCCAPHAARSSRVDAAPPLDARGDATDHRRGAPPASVPRAAPGASIKHTYECGRQDAGRSPSPPPPPG
jgi:hypothetical protein